ncbi:MAG: TatD family hydrolase [Fervidicoccaceae archaeon]
MSEGIFQKYVDAHSHAHEYDVDFLKSLGNEFIIIAVSDDIQSSRRTIDLSARFDFVKPCIGIHPWKIEMANKEALKELETLLNEMDHPCLGEIGLDKKFVPSTYELQLRAFERFLQAARENDAVINLHAAGAWQEVAELVIKKDISKALFHWYTGPPDLMYRLQDFGYFISFNVAAVIQKKHAELIRTAKLDNVLTESDGPYTYRGQKLTTDRIPVLLEFLAKEVGIDLEKMREIVLKNALKLLR